MPYLRMNPPHSPKYPAKGKKEILNIICKFGKFDLVLISSSLRDNMDRSDSRHQGLICKSGSPAKKRGCFSSRSGCQGSEDPEADQTKG